MSQAKPPFIASPPPTSRPKGKWRGRIFHVVRENVRVGGAMATHHSDTPLGGGRAGWSADWYHSMTDHQFCAQFNMKMDNDVLLLSYLDKICLILTCDGELWRVYIVKRGYIRDPERWLALSRLHYILQATSQCERRKSATAAHVEQ